MMKLTKDGKALYLHCLPADISGLSCPEGEVDNSVFDRYLVPLYKQASYKPYIIAAMIFLAQVKDPVRALMELDAVRRRAQDVLRDRAQLKRAASAALFLRPLHSGKR